MPLRRYLTGLLVLVANVALFGAWGGQLDGNRHPMVGAAYVDFNGSGRIEWFELACSGAYAGPSKTATSEVFLTVGHCVMPLNTFGGFSDFWVSFDANPRDGGGVPENLILANGFAWDPRFGHDQGNLYDSAVLLLPFGSVPGINPVELPPAGYLDDLKRAGTLQHSVFELVGYGVVPTWQQPGGTQFFFDGQRRASSSQVKGLTQAWLQFNQNVEATDLGGLCYGDSGSPQFVPNSRMIVSTTSGGDTNCRANNYNYRLDTVGAREFFGQFLNLP
jgi:hypothetical protein